MSEKEGFIGRAKDKATKAARTLSAGVIATGFASGFSPPLDVSTTLHTAETGTHLVIEKGLFELENFELSNLKPDLSTEDADKIAMTAFVGAYMIGMWAQVRKNLEIAHGREKLLGWPGVSVQTLVAAYGIARIWEADFGDIEDDIDKVAITGFISGYLGTKAALTWRGMSNGLPWTKAIGEAGVGAEAVAGAYGIARVTEVIK